MYEYVYTVVYCIDQQVSRVLPYFKLLDSRFHSTLGPPHWWSVCGALRCPCSTIWLKSGRKNHPRVEGWLHLFPMVFHGFSISWTTNLWLFRGFSHIVSSTEVLRYLHRRGQSVAIFDTSRLRRRRSTLAEKLREPSSPGEKYTWKMDCDDMWWYPIYCW